MRGLKVGWRLLYIVNKERSGAEAWLLSRQNSTAFLYVRTGHLGAPIERKGSLPDGERYIGTRRGALPQPEGESYGVHLQWEDGYASNPSCRMRIAFTVISPPFINEALRRSLHTVTMQDRTNVTRRDATRSIGEQPQTDR